MHTMSRFEWFVTQEALNDRSELVEFLAALLGSL
jgi:hypothetical protein